MGVLVLLSNLDGWEGVDGVDGGADLFVGERGREANLAKMETWSSEL